MPKVKKAKNERFVYQEIGRRLKQIRVLAGYPGRQQNKFADDFGFTQKSWNHWEKGQSIPWQQADKLITELKDVLPSLSLDYIYRGERRGMSVELARLLRD